MKLSRRNFLVSSAALLAVACVGKPNSLNGLMVGRKKRRFIVNTQSRYWDKQDLSQIKIDKALDLPGLAKLDLNQPHSILTVADEDGARVRHIKLPLHYHCATNNGSDDGLLYLIGNHRPSALLSIDSESLELVSICGRPSNDDNRNFGGHGVALPDGNLAFTMNKFERGRFDEISIRDPKTLKELDRFSSYGFQVHEIRLTADKKHFVCGHYGSYLGQGAYAGLGVYDKNGYKEPDKVKTIYPGSVTLVSVDSGKRTALFSDLRPGQEGHATVDAQLNAYLPNIPAKIENKTGLDKHPRFKEGLQLTPNFQEFAAKDHSLGISLDFDQKHAEIIVPDRSSTRLNITDVTTQKVKIVDILKLQGAEKFPWIKEQSDFISGLAFHPDGKHYVLSTSAGFIGMVRGSHQIQPNLTFPVDLLLHSHMLII